MAKDAADDALKVFSGSSGRAFADRICNCIGIGIGDSDTIRFSDGNLFVRVNEAVRGKDIYLVQPVGMDPNDEFMELLFWLDAFKRASAGSVTAIMPYFGYAKGDKKDEPRVSIRARVCAECLESAGADRIITMDLHSPQVQGFFRKPVDHLQALHILCEYIKKLNLNNYVIVSPDTGYAKQAGIFSGMLGVPAAIGYKTRTGHDEKAGILELCGDVDGRDAVIVDDFTISCGTLIKMAEFLKKRGACRILAATTHILLNRNGLDALDRSDIELLVSTDTVDNPFVKQSQKIRLVSAAPIFAEAIMHIHKKESISPLFRKGI